ncbi:Uncharacterized protein APZ42_033072 [Daphnia magna]|uniref:Uncharacterized protein n=1 Tax=Daphnia magna TaxID=35525 RepID=A0A164LFF3_9CRUS|nr:Uncharacterized protein APZ42_033072 [Daphnia magna]
MMAAADLFRLRTTMKRQHTKPVMRIYGMINRRASRVEVEVLSATLADVLERNTAVNDQYVITGGLDEQEQAAAETYIQEVAALSEQAQLAIGGYAHAVANRTAWNVTDSNAGRVLQPIPLAIAEEVPENEVVNHNPIVSGLAKSRNHEDDIGGTQAARNIPAAQQPTIGALVSNLDGDKSGRNASDDAHQAKRRRIELEFELERKRVERSRKRDDLLRQSGREEEDLKMAIERERILAAIDSSKVGVLIGADQLSAHVQRGIREPIEEDGPTAVLTQFGWSVIGKIPHFLVAGPSKRKSVNIQSIAQDVALCSLVQQFHSTESFGTDASVPALISTEDARVLEVLESSALFIGCGWQVELPLKSEGFVFPNNRKQAVSRFYGMERRLSLPENQQYAEKYNNIVNKLIESGTVSIVNPSAINEPKRMVCYLPHHFVEYPNKPGKIRVVMDCAASFSQV